jgi:hypothetical protein
MANDNCPALILSASLMLAVSALPTRGAENLLQNPGFEEVAQQQPAHWRWRTDNEGVAQTVEVGAHSGRVCVSLPANSAVEQQVANVLPGAYLARCWIKSAANQAVTIVVQDPEAPAATYTYADLKVPKDRWVQVEAFCAVDRAGSLTVALGGMSGEFRRYHGGTSEMRAAILVDDCELVRFERKLVAAPRVWDSGKDLSDRVDWSESVSWPVVQESAHAFTGTPVLQNTQFAGLVRKEDGSLRLYAIQGAGLRPRAVILPEPEIANAKGTFVRAGQRTGVHVSSSQEDRSYTAWLSAEGVMDIEPHGIPQFRVQECQLRYGLLPSFVGTDICYAPQKLPSVSEVKIPSTQWFVGLRDGGESMLVLVWRSGSQRTSLHLAGTGENRMVDGLSIGTQQEGFSLGLVEHAQIWGEQQLNEDWLGEYVPVGWERPFPARWMAHFFVTAGNKAFRSPHMNYAFPVANAKTRMWGVWFEDWNHYPFYFEGTRLVAHFEKSFVPNGKAIFYFLEPAAADVISPCEILEQVLGKDQAAALFDLEGNHLRKLHYSTPAEFMYDRPVCATTTRLSKIRKDEKATVGVNLATHLFEFIREIRGRVDQYVAFFDDLNAYLKAQKQAHPEAHAYIAELQALVSESRAKAKEAYDTPLSTVQEKTEAMKKQLKADQGDGFDCGSLDVRGPAGTQDDLCRRYNRLVLRLCETAVLNCGNSDDSAAIATHVWRQSRQVLREPTRWEPRRTLYFFEP